MGVGLGEGGVDMIDTELATYIQRAAKLRAVLLETGI